MSNKRRWLGATRTWVVFSFISAGLFALPAGASAQDFKDLKTPSEPLVLKSKGSFYVGGKMVEETTGELGSFIPAGKIAIDQMYVQYMTPENSGRSAPVIMVHGMALTGKTWETTPDGRMGWDEYFVRRGHSTYIVDQVARGRSGFDQRIYNDVRLGNAPPNTLPAIGRFSDAITFQNFRFGPKPGVPYDHNKFPVEAVDELAKQEVPDLTMTLSTPNPTYKALSDLAIKIKNAVIITHSQSGSYNLEAGLISTEGLGGFVLLEPGGCGLNYSDEQIRKLSKVPTLVVFGDHVDAITDIPGFSWTNAYRSCEDYVRRVKSVGGNIQLVHLPEVGFPGSTHMMMQDRNSLEIADLVLKWIDQNVDHGKSSAGSSH